MGSTHHNRMQQKVMPWKE